jgi:hypothetical protein
MMERKREQREGVDRPVVIGGGVGCRTARMKSVGGEEREE